MVTSRYEAAVLLKEHWPLLNWKGDDHTNGIYFNEQYGYIVERTYAVRIEHNEPSPSVFYVPGFNDSEDEVYVDYPFCNMTKKPNKYNYLFSGNQLEPSILETMFECDRLSVIEMEVEPLVELLHFIPKKRDRDRAWLLLGYNSNRMSASLIQRKNEGFEVVRKLRKESGCTKESDMIYITMNANNVLHALYLFSLPTSVLFSKSHDRIILTSEASIPKVEVVISLPKEQIQREIECCSYS